jgi:hypothetical protein
MLGGLGQKPRQRPEIVIHRLLVRVPPIVILVAIHPRVQKSPREHDVAFIDSDTGTGVPEIMGRSRREDRNRGDHQRAKQQQCRQDGLQVERKESQPEIGQRKQQGEEEGPAGGPSLSLPERDHRHGSHGRAHQDADQDQAKIEPAQAV